MRLRNTTNVTLQPDGALICRAPVVTEMRRVETDGNMLSVPSRPTPYLRCIQYTQDDTWSQLYCPGVPKPSILYQYCFFFFVPRTRACAEMLLQPTMIDPISRPKRYKAGLQEKKHMERCCSMDHVLLAVMGRLYAREGRVHGND